MAQFAPSPIDPLAGLREARDRALDAITDLEELACRSAGRAGRAGVLLHLDQARERVEDAAVLAGVGRRG